MFAQRVFGRRTRDAAFGLGPPPQDRGERDLRTSQSWPTLVHLTPGQQGAGNVTAQLAKSGRFAISGILFVAALISGRSGTFAADGCPTSASEISTDRPDVTNSSRVVPYGSLQAENGVDWSVHQGSNVVSGSETRLRLGVAQCTEVLADVPTYFYSLNGRASSGFSDFVVSIKRELPVPFGFRLSATSGLGFPTGASKISSHGYDPYIQFPWSRRISDEWSLQGMFTVTWFTSQHTAIRPLNRRCRLTGLRAGARLVRGVRRRLSQPRKTQSDPRRRRLVASDKTSATRLSHRLWAQRQFLRPLLRHRVFVSARRAIRRFGW